MTSLEILLSESEPAPVAVFKRNSVHLYSELEQEFEKDRMNAYNKKGAIDLPPDIPYWKEVQSKFDTKVSQLAMIDSSLCWVDRSYDRKVNWANLIHFIDDKNGFSYSASQIIDVVYDRVKQRFYVIIGQHRVDMSLLCMGKDAKIAARIILLDKDLSEEEQIKLESSCHHTEANNITTQKPQERLLSGYTSGDKDAVAYTTFITSHNIGVVGQEHLFPEKSFVKTCKAPWSVGRAMQKCSPKDCSFALLLIRDYMDCTEIDGKLILSVTQYLYFFKKRLKKTAQVCGTSYEGFVRDFFEYAFSQESEKGVMRHPTEDLLEGAKDFRGESTVVPVCRLVKLTNHYVRFRKINVSSIHGNKKNGNKLISAEEDIFGAYLNQCNVGQVLATIPRQIINSL